MLPDYLVAARFVMSTPATPPQPVRADENFTQGIPDLREH